MPAYMTQGNEVVISPGGPTLQPQNQVEMHAGIEVPSAAPPPPPPPSAQPPTVGGQHGPTPDSAQGRMSQIQQEHQQEVRESVLDNTVVEQDVLAQIEQENAMMGKIPPPPKPPGHLQPSPPAYQPPAQPPAPDDDLFGPPPQIPQTAPAQQPAFTPVMNYERLDHSLGVIGPEFAPMITNPAINQKVIELHKKATLLDDYQHIYGQKIKTMEESIKDKDQLIQELEVAQDTLDDQKYLIENGLLNFLLVDLKVPYRMIEDVYLTQWAYHKGDAKQQESARQKIQVQDNTYKQIMAQRKSLREIEKKQSEVNKKEKDIEHQRKLEQERKNNIIVNEMHQKLNDVMTQYPEIASFVQKKNEEAGDKNYSFFRIMEMGAKHNGIPFNQAMGKFLQNHGFVPKQEIRLGTAVTAHAPTLPNVPHGTQQMVHNQYAPGGQRPDLTTMEGLHKMMDETYGPDRIIHEIPLDA